MGYGNIEDTAGQKHKNSNVEFTFGDHEVTTFEDLQASPRPVGRTEDRGEAAFEVFSQHGFPRTLLGVLRFTAKGCSIE